MALLRHVLLGRRPLWCSCIGLNRQQHGGETFMRMKSVVAAGIGVAALVIAGSGSAYAGEITGNGKPTQGPAHANSICVFSGLEDGDGAGFPGPGGAPPQ